MTNPCANLDTTSQEARPLEPTAARRLHVAGGAEDAGLTLREALEQVGTPLGGDMWDIDGTVVRASASGGLWRFRPTGARRDALDGYHGLRCSRCGGDVRHPVSLPGRGYLLGPFHDSCARDVEAEFHRQAAATRDHSEVRPEASPSGAKSLPEQGRRDLA